MDFPVEAVPDGSVWLPHHFLYPLYAILVIYLLYLNDDPDARPVLVFVGAVVGLYGWFHLWPFYPATGAVVCLVGVCITVVGAVAHAAIPTRWRVVVVALALFALDDWISHALGIQTLASWVFDGHIAHHLP